MRSTGTLINDASEPLSEVAKHAAAQRKKIILENTNPSNKNKNKNKNRKKKEKRKLLI